MSPPSSTSLQIPASSSSAARPASLAAPTVSPRKQREETNGYMDVYSHPAAIAYASAHPRRTIPKFGPYLLLQTLGEGEFGKVKLGLHSQWGEEAAVKLIRRGNVDSNVRMSKVEREIEVLRTLKHPNIVRLYDVIETDKYIGIIIEYASGGELFDHILAHRYLKERDAQKLFSQLISGVWYIHQKKIVHRDLKLENLLLDRHRNVIITDFGFANRFEHKADDLMQTSCGSPCYAAPELVISEGLYVGSAVDIWSCGVILYAMLAGYLPFDDDPANPDGDNINLLYKYIVNTPLSFPDYISEGARDLLRLMLVPDPRRRASLEKVMKHPWLAAYDSPPSAAALESGKPTAFGKTVEELEKAAMEQHQSKRRAYQMQMKALVSPSSSQSPSPPTAGMGRSGHSSHKTDSGYATSPPTREFLYETGMDSSVSSPAGFPAPPSAPPRADAMVVDDPFAAPPGVIPPPTPSLPSQETTPKKKHHHHHANSGGQRHTIQLEYDDSRERERERSSSKRQRSRSGSRSRTNAPTESPTRKRKGSSGAGTASGKPLPSPPPTTSRSNSGAVVPPVTTPETVSYTPPMPYITIGGSPSRPGEGVGVEATPPDTPITFVRSDAAMAASLEKEPSTPVNTTPEKDKEGSANGSASSSTRHKRGASGALGGLVKIFGASSSSGLESPTTPTQSQAPSIPVSASVSSASTDASAPAGGESLSPTKKGTTTRRNTLTVIVEPISRTIKGRSGSSAKPPSTPASSRQPESGSVSAIEPSSTRGIRSGIPPPSPAPATGYLSDAGVATGVTEDGVGTGGKASASTSKARGVMQWFRNRSKGRESVGLLSPSDAAAPVPPPVPMTPGVGEKKSAGSSRALTPTPTLKEKEKEGGSITPSFIHRFRNSVTVGGVASPSPKPAPATSKSSQSSSAGAGYALRIHHGAVDTSTVTTKPPPEVIKHVKEVLAEMGVEVSVEGEYKVRCVRPKRAGGTTKRPGTSASTAPGGVGSLGNVALFSITGSAGSNGVDKRGLPLPSSSSSLSNASLNAGGGGMLRGLLMRRQSSQVSASVPMGPSTSFDDPDISMVSPISPSSSSDHPNHLPPSSSYSGSPEPVYGPPTQDIGDEVRFSVELTRLDRLNDTYSLDIRRLKGNLRSYKFLYDAIRQRVDLR